MPTPVATSARSIAPRDFVPRIWPLVDESPKDPGAGSGLVFIVRYGTKEDQARAGKLLFEHHAEHPGIESSIYALARIDDETVKRGVDAVFARKWKGIDADPGSDASREALSWLVTYAPDTDNKAKAARLLFEHHAEHESLARMIPSLARIDDDSVRAGIAKMAESAPTREARGQAMASLADGMLTSRNKNGGEADDANEKEIRALLTRVSKEYGDLQGRRGTLGEEAETKLASMRTHGVGRVAPEIAGDDTDGVAFKLSDYRGKAILLDFWGHW